MKYPIVINSFIFLTLCLFLFACGEADKVNGVPEKKDEIILSDHTLSTDETWTPAQSYTINGELRIPPTVELEITPGTIVNFGVDAYVVVRGTLKIGTPLSQTVLDDFVYLSPNSGSPDSGDWRGFIFDHTHDVDSFFRGVVIENAKIALDIKTASPTIIDSLLQHNDTAIALDGSNSIILHNRIINNEIGIITIGRQTRPRIEKNNIFENNSGIICENVQSIIKYNNLERNDFSLRLQVKFDLNVSDNWWGSTSEKIIDELILDSQDSNLITKPVGTVTYQPVSALHFTDAGPRE
ncbi:right-handed parallel beta-helix repeat-containing protein [Candidatus Poribacteria bacterium]|nr:right-handed parallel beta-helix repeat-containing protein [Candidatus Poribacteria bacterium]